MNSRMLLILATGLVISGCSFSPAPASTPTPPPTVTSPPTATPSPTQTPKSNSISIAFPTAGGLAPRWMILGQPGHSVEILGEKWNYADDRWGETYGCIDYTRETGTQMRFEQCFAVVDNDEVSFESQRDLFLGDNFEILVPEKSFGDVGQISLMGKRLVGSPKKTIEFLEIIGVEEYVLLVELYIETDNTDSLQSIYENELSDIMDYVLQNSLEKSRLIPRPTATPLSPSQANFYDDMAAKLITEPEASALYLATWIGEVEGSVDGTWESLGDSIGSKRQQVCRLFEDRTNADVRWVKFKNCIFAVKDFPFASIADFYKQPGDIAVTSSYEYENNFVIYGYNDGHTYFDSYLLNGEFIYHISVETRTLQGETVKDVFNQTIDDFIYNVLMTNVNN